VADDGLNKYKTLYIDPIAQQLANFPSVRVALVIEPDSLPNLATNLGVPKCQEAKVSTVLQYRPSGPPLTATQ
jgi:cellulose 1,4-beta-cellobiosidase